MTPDTFGIDRPALLVEQPDEAELKAVYDRWRSEADHDADFAMLNDDSWHPDDINRLLVAFASNLARSV